VAKDYSEPHEARPLPALLHHERRELMRRRRAHERGAPESEAPPWVLADEADEDDALASFVALTLAKRSRSGEHEPWLVRGVLRRSAEGPPMLSRASVEHFDNPEVEVTSTAMRDINFGTIRERACGALALKQDVFDAVTKTEGLAADELAALVGWNEQWIRDVAAEAQRVPLRRGRPGYPEEHYRWIALRYLALIKEGRRDVLKALAAEEGRRLSREVPRETVRDWVRKATELKFLAPGKQGRASARPGPDLYPRRST
jgi:hypothetical protein